MSMNRKQRKTKQKMKGNDGMQAVLKNSNVTLKMQLLKARANKVLRDNSIRHTPNKHDIKECSNNTKLLHTHQERTIRKKD